MANNIILQTIKDVEFFNTQVFLEIFAKERQAYLILSKQKPFDIDSLKEYLIENNLNQFAKKEIIRLIEVIDYFADLNTKYKEIPINNNFYHYKNDNNGGTTECSGLGKLFYILNTNDRFIKTNEDNFKERHKSNLIFTSLTASRISMKLNEIKDLFVDFIKTENINNDQPQQIENNKTDEVFKNQYLFKVGLLFAKGTMNKYFTVTSKNATVMNSGFTAPKIANELGNDSYNKYILASINNYTNKENGNKNIFNSLDMMTKIILHCERENIPVDTYFKSRLPIE